MDSFLLFHPDSIQIWVHPVGNSDSALAVRISWGVCAVIVAWLLRSQIPLAQRSNLPGRQAEVELKGGVEGQEPALLEPPLSRGSISFSKDMLWRRRGQNHTTTMSPGQNGSKSAALWPKGNISRLNNRLLSRLPGRSAVYIVASCVISRCFSVCQWPLRGVGFNDLDMSLSKAIQIATLRIGRENTAQLPGETHPPGFEKAMRPSCGETRQNRRLAA